MSRKLSFRSASSRRGATVVELALVAPIFFLVVFAVVEFGRAVMIKQSLTEAARAGARCAALATTLGTDRAENAVREYLRQTMTDSFDMSRCQISIAPSGLGALDPGTPVTARVEVAFRDVSWITPSFMAAGVIQGEASITRE